MKKISFLATLFAIIAMVACNPIEQQPGGDTPKGDGTQAKPYSVAEAIKAAAGEAWVKGVIVGFMESTEDADFPVFTTSESDSIKTNVIIAYTITETEILMPINLPAGDVRTLVNLVDNKDNLGKEIILYGTIAKYFDMTGVRNTVYAKIGENEAGIIPGSGLFSYTFSSSLGEFIEYSVVGDQKWIIDEKYGYATISGYVNEQNLENEDWLISPKIALDKVEAAKMTIDHVIRYSGNAMTDCTVWVSEDYEEGNPNEATWNQIPTSFKDGEDWTITTSAEMNLTPYCGKVVRVAFKYVSKQKAGTWEIRTVLIEEGQAAEDPNQLNPTGEGTQEAPYNVAATIVNQGAGQKWVEGYIVGVYNFDASDKFVFGYDTIKSNILLADVSGAAQNYIAVQLPAGEIRTALNIVDNEANIGKKVKVYGSLEKYCGISGVKSLVKAEIDGNLIDCEVVVSDAVAVTVAEFIDKPVDSKVWYELTGVISGAINTTYGNFDLVDETGSVYVYGLTATPQSTNDKSYASLGLEAGDKIKIRGTRGDYNGKVEVMNAYFVELVQKGAGEPEQPENPTNPEVGDATPITVAEFLNKPVDSKVWYELTGVISGAINTTYGNFDLVDETGSVYVYGLTATPQSTNDQSYASLGLEAGDKIKIRGTRGDYNGKVEVMNAYFVELVQKGAGEPEQPDPNQPGEGEPGSEADPYTIDEAFANQGAKDNGAYVWIEGYIVGFVDGKNYSNIVFGVNGTTNTNIVIAASADETDASKCLPVQLPKGAIRDGLNVVANPTNLGKAVKLQGTLEPYFGKPGIKFVKKAYIEGVEVK